MPLIMGAPSRAGALQSQLYQQLAPAEIWPLLRRRVQRSSEVIGLGHKVPWAGRRHPPSVARRGGGATPVRPGPPVSEPSQTVAMCSPSARCWLRRLPVCFQRRYAPTPDRRSPSPAGARSPTRARCGAGRGRVPHVIWPACSSVSGSLLDPAGLAAKATGRLGVTAEQIYDALGVDPPAPAPDAEPATLLRLQYTTGCREALSRRYAPHYATGTTTSAPSTCSSAP